MNRQEAKKWLPVIAAWADGGNVQVRKNEAYKWEDCAYPYWEVGQEYRIKPKTKKIGYGVTLHKFLNGDISPVAAQSEAHFNSLCKQDSCVRILHAWKEWEEEVNE